MSTTTTMPAAQSPPPGEKKGMFDTLGKHASSLGESFTGLFSKKKTPTATTPGQAGGRSRRRRRSRSRKGGNPKKGMASKSRKGRKDFVTHKGDKYYNRKGHRQSRNAKGKRKSPYKKH
jgi:hypothetical protein